MQRDFGPDGLDEDEEELPWDEVDVDAHEAEETYVTLDTRREVLLRDDCRCRNCGEPDMSKLHLHHVVYRSQGGGHDPENLCTLCSVCHIKVHDKKLIVVRKNGTWFFGKPSGWRHRRK